MKNQLADYGLESWVYHNMQKKKWDTIAQII